MGRPETAKYWHGRLAGRCLLERYAFTPGLSSMLTAAGGARLEVAARAISRRPLTGRRSSHPLVVG
jgi:hypothetical protein